MHKYRILSNGGSWRVQRRSFLFFWKTACQESYRDMAGNYSSRPREFPTLTEATDFIREYEAGPVGWKVYEYFTPETPAPQCEP